jgi:hypothetical protein
MCKTPWVEGKTLWVKKGHENLPKSRIGIKLCGSLLGLNVKLYGLKEKTPSFNPVD